MALWDDTRLVDFRMEPALKPVRISEFVEGRGQLAGAIYCSVAHDIHVLA